MKFIPKRIIKINYLQKIEKENVNVNKYILNNLIYLNNFKLKLKLNV